MINGPQDEGSTDSKLHVAHMGPTWGRQAQCGPMELAILLRTQIDAAAEVCCEGCAADGGSGWSIAKTVVGVVDEVKVGDEVVGGEHGACCGR